MASNGSYAREIALTNGSQNAFFYLFNLLAGEFAWKL
jgi:valine--pyruvate aminotransferase